MVTRLCIGSVALSRLSARSGLGFCAMCTLPIAKKQRRMAVQTQEAVKLSEEERSIFNTLLEAERHFNLGTQLRVAGGWVRDKLLGKDSYDIDIALDNMLGQEFCEKVNEYLKTIGEETHNIGVITSNPDQSKHLETARMRVRGVWLDFVNLRAETYAEDSRIPTMEFGTPKKDAERRDLTINSLFYNINTGQVEDYTERGIEHLKSGIIATPLEPKVTFLDDPLRVLRSIRFGARFGFQLEDDLKQAASSEEVRSALAKKISKERVGHEIELMLEGNVPTEAMKLLLELKLFPVVFSPPPTLQRPLSDGWERKCVECLQAATDVLDRFGPSKLNAEQKRVFLFSALLFPLKYSTYEDRKLKVFPTTSFIIRESLKLKNNDVDGVIAMHESAEQFVDVVKILLSVDGENIPRGHNAAETWEAVQRLEAGLLLMKIKKLWRGALVLSSIIDVYDFPNWDAKQKADICSAVEEIIIRLGLENIWEMKALVDGKEIMQVLSLPGGPAVKQWKDLAIEWQLAHPSGTAEECKEWLKIQHTKS